MRRQSGRGKTGQGETSKRTKRMRRIKSKVTRRIDRGRGRGMFRFLDNICMFNRCGRPTKAAMGPHLTHYFFRLLHPLATCCPRCRFPSTFCSPFPVLSVSIHASICVHVCIYIIFILVFRCVCVCIPCFYRSYAH